MDSWNVKITGIAIVEVTSTIFLSWSSLDNACIIARLNVKFVTSRMRHPNSFLFLEREKGKFPRLYMPFPKECPITRLGICIDLNEIVLTQVYLYNLTISIGQSRPTWHWNNKVWYFLLVSYCTFTKKVLLPRSEMSKQNKEGISNNRNMIC